MKFKEVELLIETIQPGLERLVSYVDNILGDKVDRKEVRKYIRSLKNDTEFINRISERAKELDKPGYIWSSIRGRTLQHFKKQLKK